MSYLDTLVVLARLQLDHAFRRRFLADPAATLSESALSAEEQRGLALLPQRAVERFGLMADEHRVLRIAEHVPWFDTQARPELAPLLARYEACTPPQLLNRLEARAFCIYLEGLPAQSPPYLQELARYERLRIELSWELGPIRDGRHIEHFSYPLDQIRAALSAPGWPTATPTPTRLLFGKVPGLPAVLIRAV